MEQNYRDLWSEYTKTLKQRNEALKSQKGNLAPWTEKLATNTDLTAVTWKEPKTTDESIRGADAEGRNPETKEDRVAPYKRRNTEYPYNRTYETESGHIVEFDDTPFAERIYEKHRTGTFYAVSYTHLTLPTNREV